MGTDQLLHKPGFFENGPWTGLLEGPGEEKGIPVRSVHLKRLHLVSSEGLEGPDPMVPVDQGAVLGEKHRRTLAFRVDGGGEGGDPSGVKDPEGREGLGEVVELETHGRPLWRAPPWRRRGLAGRSRVDFGKFQEQWMVF
jgi:hypothetical protein